MKQKPLNNHDTSNVLTDSLLDKQKLYGHDSSNTDILAEKNEDARTNPSIEQHTISTCPMPTTFAANPKTQRKYWYEDQTYTKLRKDEDCFEFKATKDKDVSANPMWNQYTTHLSAKAKSKSRTTSSNSNAREY